MIRILVSTLVAALALAHSGGVRLQPDSGSVRLQPDLNGAGISEVQRLFREPPADSRIMMRWLMTGR